MRVLHPRPTWLTPLEVAAVTSTREKETTNVLPRKKRGRPTKDSFMKHKGDNIETSAHERALDVRKSKKASILEAKRSKLKLSQPKADDSDI